ncbi:MAG TPA: CDP-alcohol phosphatidyltransferase family protein [Candidatus Goldiibacteriota bacterium]|nr:CDP-alcohol phosphatidyltransferase family protein [Candidatus Goldiibacteriota bacterium]
MGYKQIRDRLKVISESVLSPIIAFFDRIGITPNMLTLFGLTVNIAAAFLITSGFLPSAGLIILFAGVFDMLDGALARKTGKKSRFGGFLDSVTDRISEGAFYLAIVLLYINEGKGPMAGLSYAAMFLSFLISYIRARAGAMQIDCEEGFFTRTERIITLVLGLLFSPLFDSLSAAIWIITIFSGITVAQRIYIVYIRANKTQKKKAK